MKPTTWQSWALLFTTSCFKFCLTAFCMIALMTMLKEMGFGLSDLSWLYLIAWLETFKCVIAPLVERLRLKFGRFKSVFLASNVAMLLGLLELYWLDPVTQFPLLLICLAIITIASLFFGCTLLGFSCAIFPPEQRGFIGVIQVIASRLGKMIGGGLVLLIFQHYGWQSAVGILAMFSLLLILQNMCYFEPLAESQTDCSLSQLTRRFVQFWQQPQTGWLWGLGLFLFFIPSSMVVSLFVPTLKALGWQPQQIGLLLSVIEPIVVMIFTPLSGILLKRATPLKLTQQLLACQIPLFSLFYLFPLFELTSTLFTVLPILLLSISYGFLVPCVMTLLMEKSDTKLATLDTSLQFSVVLCGAYLAGFVALRLANYWGTDSVYLFAVMAVVVLRSVSLRL